MQGQPLLKIFAEGQVSLHFKHVTWTSLVQMQQLCRWLKPPRQRKKQSESLGYPVTQWWNPQLL